MSVPFSVSQRRLFVNGVAVFGGEAAARLATFLMAVVVARHFGPVALGQYGYALAFASILLLVPDFGLHLFMVRELSANPERRRRVFWSIHWLKFFLVGGVLLFTVFFGPWGISDAGRRILFYILAGRVILQTFSQASMAVFKAQEQMHHIALQQLVNSVLVVGWTGMALAVHASLPGVVVALLVGQAAETCLGWRILQSNFSPGRPSEWDRKLLSTIAFASVPIGVTAIVQALNLRIDILVLGLYVPNRALGQFQAAAWFPVATFLVASLLMTVVFPKLSRLVRTRSARGSAYVTSLLKNGILLTALGALVVWFIAPTLIPWLFGRDLGPAADTLRILAPALPLVFLNTVLFYVFVAAQRRFVYLSTLGMGLTVGTALSFLLTSAYGATGCAVADVVREFVISAAFLYFLVQGDHARIAGLGLLKVFAGATLVMASGTILATPIRYGDQWFAA